MKYTLQNNKLKITVDSHGAELTEIVNKENIEEIIKHPEMVETPWYGQLMRAPQMLANLIQIEYWVANNNITII